MRMCSTKTRVVAQRPEIQLRRKARMLPQMIWKLVAGDSRVADAGSKVQVGAGEQKELQGECLRKKQKTELLVYT